VAPAAAAAGPRSADLDPALLGEAVALSGGSIRNAALHAAFLAAAQGQPIGLGQVAHAVWRELAKEGRELSPQDLGPLARHLPRSCAMRLEIDHLALQLPAGFEAGRRASPTCWARPWPGPSTWAAWP
jgi:hypothetical protein